MTQESAPLVSVVTPFYNTADYLQECIESVLAQTHRDFEYVLVNNKSTDRSREIAAEYARRDDRIRFYDTDSFLTQVQNYNGAVARMHPGSKYLKIVQADDALMPECLARMVEVAEREPGIGLVGSYWLNGTEIAGSGIPHQKSRVSGRDACRMMLLNEAFLVGTPTTVLYPAEVVRERTPFYKEGRYHEDTEAAIEILLRRDLGFVHQLLSFNRTDNVSITSRTFSYHPNALDHLMLVEQYGEACLTPQELRESRSRARAEYLNYLARSLLRGRERAFWDYHRKGLASIGWNLSWGEVLPRTVSEVLKLALNPLSTVERLVGELGRKRTAGSQSAASARPPQS